MAVLPRAASRLSLMPSDYTFHTPGGFSCSHSFLHFLYIPSPLAPAGMTTQAFPYFLFSFFAVYTHLFSLCCFLDVRGVQFFVLRHVYLPIMYFFNSDKLNHCMYCSRIEAFLETKKGYTAWMWVTPRRHSSLSGICTCHHKRLRTSRSDRARRYFRGNDKFVNPQVRRRTDQKDFEPVWLDSLIACRLGSLSVLPLPISLSKR